VLAPTKLPNGQYEWLNDLAPAELPQWVADLAGTVSERNEAPDAEFTPTYTQEEFAERLNLIPVENYDRKHDRWVELMLACTHASTVEDGKEAFMEWTTRSGPGDRVGYASDYDEIAARWDANFAKRNMAGKVVKVGTFNKHLTDAGHSDKVKNAWDSTAEEDFGVAQGGDGSAPPPAAVSRPQVVLVKGNLPQATRLTKKFLIKDSAKRECPASDRIFRRGEKLAHLNRNELAPEDDIHDKDYHVADDLVIRLADVDWLGDRADRCICYQRPNKDNELVPADVPDKLLRRVEKIITPYDFPHLLGTVETPTLRADHSVLDVPGYDRRSGLYYDPGRAVFPKIDDRPSKAQAEAALALFIGDTGILHDFPFNDANDEEEGLSRSVALAMLLTAVARRALATAPMFGIDAFEAQSGKTFLAQIAAIMATGRKTAERPWPTNEEERRKNLGAALEAGDPVLLYDNVETPLEGAAFAGAITESKFQDRRLGSNSGKDQIIAPTNALILATGNHLIAQGDMSEGRVLVTRIVPESELAVRMFIHRDLARYCIAHRPELVIAALAILRAYVTSSTKMPLTGFRHREWGDLIAAAIEWLGLPNPCLAMSRAQAADPVREVQSDVVRAWAKRFGEQWVTAQELISETRIATVIAGVNGIEKNRLTYKTAVPFVRGMIGVARLGFKVQSIKGDDKHPARWRLRAAVAANVADVEPDDVEPELEQWEIDARAAADFADDPPECEPLA
jgi:hypothetical protein